MPTTRSRARTSRVDVEDERHARDVPQLVVHAKAIAEKDDDEEAPEEVTAARAREGAARERAIEQRMRRANATKAKEMRSKAREETSARRGTAGEGSEGDGGGRERDARAGRDSEDDLEELPEDVVREMSRRRAIGGRGDRLGDDERENGGARDGKKKKGEAMRKRSRYEREGFRVVALDAAEDEDERGVSAPRSAMDFMRERLIDKHVRSGTMLRDSKTGKVPNAFARR